MTSAEMQLAYERLRASVNDLDERAHTILAMHAAIERELDTALAAAVPNPNALERLSFGHKVSVWSAMNPGNSAKTENLAASILRFNDLRNSVAHGDSKRNVESCLRSLLASIPGAEKEDPTLTLWVAAGFIFGVLNVGD